MSINYEAVLDVSERSARFLSKLLHEERIMRGTRKDTRSLSTYKQAVLVLRWFLDDNFIDLGADFYDIRIGPERKKRTHIRQLEALGYRVILEPAV